MWWYRRHISIYETYYKSLRYLINQNYSKAKITANLVWFEHRMENNMKQFQQEIN